MFHGSIVALVTPMLEDRIDLIRLRELVDWHVASGTHAIVAAGTTGESGTLSFDEKRLVIRTVIEQARERIPVIAGTAANATKACIELTRYAMQAGACASLIMTPAYIKPTQEGLYAHYKAIADAVPMPIILYNVPSRTGCDLLPETVHRLSLISNIVGIKEAVGDIERLEALLSAESLDIYSGDDLTAAQWMLYPQQLGIPGVKGVISVTANVAPVLMAEMCALARAGDAEGCLAVDKKLAQLHRLLFIETNPIPVKWLLSHLGRIHDEIRLPLTPLSIEHRQALLAAIEGCK